MSSSERLELRIGAFHEETGSSLVEFVMLAVLVLIPVIYFILGVAGVQAAAYASVGASDQAAKMYVGGSEDLSPDVRAARSQAAATAALQDFGIAPTQTQISMTCPKGSCENDGDLVTFTVVVRVPVPLIPDMGSWQSTLVTVSSTSTHVQAG